MLRHIVPLVGLLVAIAVRSTSAALVIVPFQGTVQTTDADFSLGEAFSGQFIYESSTLPYLQPGYPTQYPSAVTSWTVSFPAHSYAFASTAGFIATTDNVLSGTSYDRYTVTVGGPSSSIGAPLPSGRSLNFFQIDWIDFVGLDLMNDESINVPPSPALASNPNGRLNFTNNSNTYLTFTATQSSNVPEPASILVWSLLVLTCWGVGLCRRLPCRLLLVK
jgi:hypothetical protein